MVLLSQPISSDTWLARNLQIVHDLGYQWEQNSLFKPYNSADLLINKNTVKQGHGSWLLRDLNTYATRADKNFQASEDKIAATVWPGLRGLFTTGSRKPLPANASAIYLVGQFRLRQHFGAECYIRSASDPNALPHFTPHDRNIKRLGMNSGEIDQATIHYQNDWVRLQFGRGRQIWGPDLVNNLILSANSAAYDHFLAQVRYRNWTGIFFTGFLESMRQDPLFYNRYIVGHGIQYHNRKNFIFAIVEVTNYYGANRPMDLAYLNPLLPHVEVELNNRENNPDRNNSNAVWVLMLDWLLPHRTRLSASYLIDEFQLDQKDRDQGRPDATGLSLRLSKSLVFRQSALTFYSHYTRVGTYTFRHEHPYTTFVSRGLPLGIPDGSDFDKISFGARVILPFRTLVELNYAYRRSGENNLLTNLYTPYTTFRKTQFPSGSVTSTETWGAQLLYSFRPHLELEIKYQYEYDSSLGRGDYVLFTVNGHWPFIFSF